MVLHSKSIALCGQNISFAQSIAGFLENGRVAAPVRSNNHHTSLQKGDFGVPICFGELIELLGSLTALICIKGVNPFLMDECVINCISSLN